MEEVPKPGEMPLKGLKVLEMGQLLAGPFASMLLAWFGAEVIKIEQPGEGDPLRTWRTVHNGTSLWWYILGRNKKSITLDLHSPKAHELVRRLVEKSDVLLENFKPGTLEKWSLGYEELVRIHPGLIMVRVSGWGQTGPNSYMPGYASVAEGVGGLRYVTGYPNQPPVRPNLSLGDTLAGLHAALGVLIAIYHRDVRKMEKGQMVDVAIYESVFNMMESVVPEYDLLGIIRERQGSQLSGIVPTNTYLCKDHRYIIIGGNGDRIFQRLMDAAGRPDMARDPRFARNTDRVEHQEEIDDAISAWTQQHSYEEVLTCLKAASVPAGPIYSIADIMADAHFQARGLFESVQLPDGTSFRLPTLTPKLTKTPGRTEWIGPALGSHNREIYCGLLGLTEHELSDLEKEGVV